MRYVPAWFPGAGWKHKAKAYHDYLEEMLRAPFELVKKDINDTFAGLSFDASTLPVPAQNTVSFCGDMDTSVVDNLSRFAPQAIRVLRLVDQDVNQDHVSSWWIIERVVDG